MVMMEGWSPTTISPLLLRNLIASLFIFADKSFLNLSEKSKLLQLIRYTFVTSFLFLLRFLPPLNPNNNQPYKSPNKNASDHTSDHYDYTLASCGGGATITGGGDSAIARALSQLLSLVNDIPVSSRKYQVVRSLAENLIDDNHKEGVGALRQVNRTVLSAAFSTTLSQLEASTILEQQGDVRGGDGVDLLGNARPAENRWSSVLRVVRSIRDVAWIRGTRASGTRSSAEKLAAEVLWLAEKLAACDLADEAVRRWAAAFNLALLSLSVEPRLQASLVKASEVFDVNLQILRKKGGGLIDKFLEDLPKENYSDAFFLGAREMELLCPEMENQLDKLLEVRRHWHISRSSEFVFEVRSDDSVMVDLEKWYCSGCQWQIKGFPCSHAVATIMHNDGNPCDYIEDSSVILHF